ncbi:MAG: methylenetetrahydrofolate reductase [NAD(P)H], partial [Alphaproteobacteria bacterium]
MPPGTLSWYKLRKAGSVRKTTFSFELFPPKTEQASARLWAQMPELIALKPDFMTVTYGAGGTTKGGTLETIEKMMEMTDIPVGSHLTFINATKDELRTYVDKLLEKGIGHIIALRGDMPGDLNWPLDNDGDYFQYTSDFVEGLKSWHPTLEISVGAYPEKHPDAPSLEDDIQALKKKCDAGATRAITQFYFDNEQYYHFVEQCRNAGIDTSIVPGLLPIHDFEGMCKFAARCQTHVPSAMYEKFGSLLDQPDEARKLAIELLTVQVEDLIRNDVEHIHFYTLNKADIVK